MYSKIERYRSLDEELDSLYGVKIGNPIPAWLFAIIGGLILTGGGLAIFQLWRASEPFVQSMQYVAPMIATGFAILVNIMALLPFFLMFMTIMNIFGAFGG